MNKTRLGPCITFFPQPTTLISTVDDKGEVNIMTASWVGIVSKTPPTIGVSLHHNRKSYENICRSKEFVVNMVPATLALEADYCGIRSGYNVDKLSVTGLTTGRADIVAPPLLNESPLNLECRLTLEVPLGEYRLLLAEILEVHIDPSAQLENGGLDVSAFDPLVYLGGVREYWSLGEKKADAYKDGLTLEGED
jgi:flavin reductase (DIM6/NTAB) family NADH-FMN oxidoreductase RutF